MKRVSSPERMALSATSRIAPPSARVPVSRMTWPMSAEDGAMASRAAEFDMSVPAPPKPRAPMSLAASATIRPTPTETAPTASRISAICGSSGRRARVARNSSASAGNSANVASPATIAPRIGSTRWWPTYSVCTASAPGGLRWPWLARPSVSIVVCACDSPDGRAP